MLGLRPVTGRTVTRRWSRGRSITGLAGAVVAVVAMMATTTNVASAQNQSSEVIWSQTFASQGWITNPDGFDTATSGFWEAGEPDSTSYEGVTFQPGFGSDDAYALVTGVKRGSSFGHHDVDGGVVSAKSAAIELPASGPIGLEFDYYFGHWSNASPSDFLWVLVREVGNPSSVRTAVSEVGDQSARAAAWTEFASSTALSGFAGKTIELLVVAADGDAASLVEAGIDDIRVTQTTIDGDAAPEVPTRAGCGGLTAEAEDGTISGKFGVESDPGASSGQFVVAPNGAGNSAFSADNVIAWCMTVPEGAGGWYRIDARTRAPSTLDDSFFVTVDDGEPVIFDVRVTEEWAVDRVNSRFVVDPVLYHLGPGSHDVRFHMREDGSQLDSIALVQMQADPSGAGGVLPDPVPTPTAIPAAAATPTVVPTATTPPAATPTVVPTATTPPAATATAVPAADIGEGLFTFENVWLGRYLDLVSGVVRSSTDPAAWEIATVGDNNGNAVVSIRDVATGNYLSTVTDSNGVQLTSAADSASTWELQPTDAADTYWIKNVESGRNLDADSKRTRFRVDTAPTFWDDKQWVITRRAGGGASPPSP